MNYIRTGCRGATLNNGKVLVVGCWYEDATIGDVYNPDLNEFTITGNVVEERAYALLFPEAGSNAVVLGGMTPYGGSQLERVELCDSVNSNFSTFNTELITGDPGWLAASPIF